MNLYKLEVVHTAFENAPVITDEFVASNMQDVLSQFEDRWEHSGKKGINACLNTFVYPELVEFRITRKQILQS